MIEQRVLKIDINKYSDKHKDLYRKFDELCFKSKNLYNLTTYYIRQMYIFTKRLHDGIEITEEQQKFIDDIHEWINKYNETTAKSKLKIKEQWYGEVLDSNILSKMLRDTGAYKSLNGDDSGTIIRNIDKIWKGYFKALTDFYKNPSKYTGRPKMPNYKDRETGRYVFTTRRCYKVENGIFQFTKKGWEDIKFKVPLENYKTTSKEKQKHNIKQVRFIHKGNIITLEIVYEIEIKDIDEERVYDINKDRVVGIDIGLIRLATVCNNIHKKPFCLNGNPLRSYNIFWNKLCNDYKSNLKKVNDKYTSKKYLSMCNKRNNHINNYLHRASKYIVNWCVDNEIDLIIIGKNKGWKQNVDGIKKKETKQSFIQIPHARLIDLIEYKAKAKGIKVITIEESYTSGTSFIDNEKPNKEYYNKDRRKFRGLFKSNEGIKIHSDVNGAYQIIKKQFKDFKYDNDYLHPNIVNL